MLYTVLSKVRTAFHTSAVDMNDHAWDTVLGLIPFPENLMNQKM